MDSVVRVDTPMIRGRGFVRVAAGRVRVISVNVVEVRPVVSQSFRLD